MARRAYCGSTLAAPAPSAGAPPPTLTPGRGPVGVAFESICLVGSPPP